MNERFVQEFKEQGYLLYIAQECEFYGFNEQGGLDEQGNVHCMRYEE